MATSADLSKLYFTLFSPSIREDLGSDSMADSFVKAVQVSGEYMKEKKSRKDGLMEKIIPLYEMK